METTEAAAMVSCQVEQATKLASAHMAVGTLFSIWEMTAEYALNIDGS